MTPVAAQYPTPTAGPTIVLLHGFGGHRWLMLPLARRLRADGYHVCNWGYRSLASDTASHAAELQAFLSTMQSDPSVSEIHIVAHSMGCIVARAALLQRSSVQPSAAEKLSKIVMICPPNHGSHIASRFAPWFGWASRTLTEICDNEGSYVNSLPQDAGQFYPLGVIAADRDFIVAKASTHLAHIRDQITLRGGHSGLLFSGQTASQVLYFLRENRFDHGERAASEAAPSSRDELAPNATDFGSGTARAVRRNRTKPFESGRAARAAPLPQTGRYSVVSGSGLGPCPRRPNCVSSQPCTSRSLFSARRLPALRFNGSCEEALQRVVEQLATQPRVKIVVLQKNYLRAQFASRTMGFIDDVEFLADSTTHELRFRSASRFGWYDFGVNRRRMTSLCNELCASGNFALKKCSKQPASRCLS